MGDSLTHYDDETRRCIAALDGRVDADRATAVWEAALEARWAGPPVWFHGDIATGNLLVDDGGRLSAVIDFGTCGVGDTLDGLVRAGKVRALGACSQRRTSRSRKRSTCGWPRTRRRRSCTPSGCFRSSSVWGSSRS